MRKKKCFIERKCKSSSSSASAVPWLLQCLLGRKCRRNWPPPRGWSVGRGPQEFRLCLFRPLFDIFWPAVPLRSPLASRSCRCSNTVWRRLTMTSSDTLLGTRRDFCWPRRFLIVLRIVLPVEDEEEISQEFVLERLDFFLSEPQLSHL